MAVGLADRRAPVVRFGDLQRPAVLRIPIVEQPFELRVGRWATTQPHVPDSSPAARLVDEEPAVGVALLASNDVYSYIVYRTQIYLDEDQAQRLDQRAATAGVTRSSMIRQAVEEYLARAEWDAASGRARWRRAVEATAGAAPYLPDGATYVDELREPDAERLRELDP